MLPPWLERFQRAALLATAFFFSAGYATIGLVLILAAVVAEGVITRRLPWYRSPIDALLISFTALFLLSGWLSQHRQIAVGSAGLAALTIYLAYGPLHRLLQRDKGFLEPFVWIWIMGGIVTAVWAIVLHRVTGRPGYTPALGQNAVGTTLLIALVLSLGVFLTSGSISRYLVVAACPLLAVGVALTYTRGAWLGAALGIMTFFFLTELRYTWRGLLLLVLVAMVGIVFTGSERSSLIQRAFTIPANQDRIFLFRSGRAIFEDHPVLGTGLNTFSLVYPKYQLPRDPNGPTQPFAHNIFLNMAAEGGTLGLFAFTAIVWMAVVAGWQWYTRSQHQIETIMSAAIFSAFLGMMVHQLFDGTMISVHLGTGLWFLIAILVAFQPRRRRFQLPS